MRKMIIAALCLLLVSSVFASLALATPHMYSVTSDHDGVDVCYGDAVDVWATTNDYDVDKVKFEWKNPSDVVVWTDSDSSRSGYNPYSFDAALHVPDALGTWTVKAYFYEWKYDHGGYYRELAVRSTVFVVVCCEPTPTPTPDPTPSPTPEPTSTPEPTPTPPPRPKPWSVTTTVHIRYGWSAIVNPKVQQPVVMHYNDEKWVVNPPYPLDPRVALYSLEDLWYKLQLWLQMMYGIPVPP